MSLAEQGDPSREYSCDKIYNVIVADVSGRITLGEGNVTLREIVCDLAEKGKPRTTRPNKRGGSSRPTDGCPPLCFPLAHMQGGPASEVKVLLSENQPLTAKEGAP
jgi:hypothetical protein